MRGDLGKNPLSPHYCIKALFLQFFPYLGSDFLPFAGNHSRVETITFLEIVLGKDKTRPGLHFIRHELHDMLVRRWISDITNQQGVYICPKR